MKGTFGWVRPSAYRQGDTATINNLGELGLEPAVSPFRAADAKQVDNLPKFTSLATPEFQFGKTDIAIRF